MTQDALWLYHPKPKPGEILSSWLCRLALGNAPRLHTFCHLVWPNRQIWNRDVDQVADRLFVARIAQGTGTSFAEAWETTLTALEGRLFGARHGSAVPRLILHVGVFHRDRRRRGQQFCPLCLSADAYFRKTWRIAWVTTCPIHNVRLHDCCPGCGTRVVFHRAKAMRLCYMCRADLTKAPVIQADSMAIGFERYLANVLTEDCGALGEATVPALTIFDILRHILRLLAQDARGAMLRSAVAEQFDLPFQAQSMPEDFEDQGVVWRYHLMMLASRLFTSWPKTFVEVCRASAFWYSWAIKDGHDLPSEFMEVAQEYLARPPYKESCIRKRDARACLEKQRLASKPYPRFRGARL